MNVDKFVKGIKEKGKYWGSACALVAALNSGVYSQELNKPVPVVYNVQESGHQSEEYSSKKYANSNLRLNAIENFKSGKYVLTEPKEAMLFLYSSHNKPMSRKRMDFEDEMKEEIQKFYLNSAADLGSTLAAFQYKGVKEKGPFLSMFENNTFKFVLAKILATVLIGEYARKNEDYWLVYLLNKGLESAVVNNDSLNKNFGTDSQLKIKLFSIGIK